MNERGDDYKKGAKKNSGEQLGMSFCIRSSFTRYSPPRAMKVRQNRTPKSRSEKS